MSFIPSEKLIGFWQIAANGIWEEARTISAEPSEQDLQSLLNWFSSAPQDIALEAFFGDRQSDDFFFYGLRIERYSKKEQKEFLRALISQTSKESTLENILQKISDLLDERIRLEKPDLLELGAEGFWKSYGSYLVWRAGEEKIASLSDIEEEAPQLLKPFTNSIMLELAWEKPLPMWLGLPVSQKIDNSFQFSLKKYQLLIDKFNPIESLSKG